MNRRMVLVLCLLAAGLPAQAQMSRQFASWSEGPQGVLLTEAERAQVSRLGSDSQARGFVRLFWARRDPNLDTAVNEFRVDFEARVAAADAQFAEGEQRGALSDRGKALILLGVPSKRRGVSIADYLDELYRERRPDDGVTRNRFIDSADEDLSYRLRHIYGLKPRAIDSDLSEDTRGQREGKSRDETIQHGIRFSLSGGTAEIWTYGPDQLPTAARVGGSKDPVTLAFFDKEASGRFAIEAAIRDAEPGLEALVVAAAGTVVHPELKEALAYPLLEGCPRASARHLGWLGAEPAPWPRGAEAVAVRGVLSSDDHPLWIFVQLPDSAPAADTMAGRLVTGDGFVAASFQMPTSGLETARGLAYEVAVPVLEPGSRVDIAMGAGDRLLAVRSFQIEPAAAGPGATHISAMVAGAEYRELSSFEPGAPFVFGGFHLVPRLDGRFSAGENLNYFCLVTRPGVGEDGKTHVLVLRELYRQGVEQPLASSAPQIASLSPVSPGVYMIGSQLPLAKLPEGDYRFDVTVSDQVSGAVRETSLSFSVDARHGSEATGS